MAVSEWHIRPTPLSTGQPGKPGLPVKVALRLVRIAAGEPTGSRDGPTWDNRAGTCRRIDETLPYWCGMLRLPLPRQPSGVVGVGHASR
jgi:hypothetical protein